MVEFLGVPNDDSEDDEEDDDIARFERQCAERAAAAGLAQRDDDGEFSEPERQDQGHRRRPTAMSVPSPRTEEEWQRGCASLQSQLALKEAELEQARAEFEHMRRDNAGVAASQDAALEMKQRVMELIKKNRRLELTNESQQKKLEQLKEAVRKPREEAQRQADELRMKNADAMFSDGAEDWKNKYLVASNKLQDSRQELQDLRVQLQRQKRALLKELGSDEVLESALVVVDDSSSGQWRGRAVQVSQLQRQLKELKEQAKQSGASIVEDGELASPRLGSQSAAAQGRSPARTNATQAADRRREEYERLQEEAERLRAEGVDVKRKRDGLKSRNNALETQLQDVKASVVELLQKSDQDDKEVDRLCAQLGRHGAADDLPNAAIEALREEHVQLRAQLERQAQIMVQLKQKKMTKVCESGSVRLGPRSVEAGIDDQQLIERLRYLEAENAHQQEQLKLLRGLGAEVPSTPSVGVAASTPPSCRSGASISRSDSFTGLS